MYGAGLGFFLLCEYSAGKIKSVAVDAWHGREMDGGQHDGTR